MAKRPCQRAAITNSRDLIGPVVRQTGKQIVELGSGLQNLQNVANSRFAKFHYPIVRGSSINYFPSFTFQVVTTKGILIPIITDSRNCLSTFKEVLACTTEFRV